MIHWFNNSSQLAAAFYHKTCAKDAFQTAKLRDKSGKLRVNTQAKNKDYISTVLRLLCVSMHLCGGGGLVTVDTVYILWYGDYLSTLRCMEEGQVSWSIVILNKATLQKVRLILTAVTEKATHSP